MRRVFKTRHFSRWMRKTELTDGALDDAVNEMVRGLIDADLGGGLVKKRLGLAGRGKRGRVRTLVATNKGNRWFFVFGFEKNERANIQDDELEALQEIAAELLVQVDSWTQRWKMERYMRLAMTTKTQTKAKSRIFDAVHETASDFRRLGFIDKRKMAKIDALCLEPVPEYDGEKIRALRDQLKLSQAVLAAVLNISLSTVRKWEIGDKRPSGPSLKLLNLLDRKGLEAVL